MRSNKKIQLIRGIAILAVILIHTVQSGLLGVALRPWLNFAVAFFLFCSGYLTKTEISDYSEFFRRRIIKVLIPYVVWTILYTFASGDYNKLWINLLTASASRPLYFIFVYIQFVLLTPWISKLIRSSWRWIGWLIMPVTLIIVRYIFVLCHFEPGFPFPEKLCLIWFTFYYLGLGLGNGIYSFDWSWKKTILIYVILVLLSEAEGFFWFYLGNSDMSLTQLRITSSASAVGACLIAYRYLRSENVRFENRKIGKALVLTGDHSFGIFLCHRFFISVLQKLPIDHRLFSFPVNSVIVFATSFLVVFLGHRLLGKYAAIFGF